MSLVWILMADIDNEKIRKIELPSSMRKKNIKICSNQTLQV